MEPAQIKQAWAERGFNYTLWTDPPGQVWQDFVHDVDELVTLIEGETRTVHSRNKHSVRALAKRC